jgi:hypothetical protein
MAKNVVELVRDVYPDDEEIVGVFMDTRDWSKVIFALEYLAARPGILERGQDEADEYSFTADSIQDVLSSL